MTHASYEEIGRVAARAELGEENWPLVQHLADRRLVVTSRTATTGLETVEVVHEALIQRWRSLRGWMHEDRVFRTWQERLRVALLGWEGSQGDEGALLRGAPLSEAQEWLGQRGGELSAAAGHLARVSNPRKGSRDYLLVNVRTLHRRGANPVGVTVRGGVDHPSYGVLRLPRVVSGEAGPAWVFAGGIARVKRPHLDRWPL